MWASTQLDMLRLKISPEIILDMGLQMFLTLVTLLFGSGEECSR